MISIGNKPTPRRDPEYDNFRRAIQARFEKVLQDHGGVLFTTDANDKLFPIYLSMFPDGVERQYHTCNACRHFFERFGGLVAINEKGEIIPALWDGADAPEFCRESIGAMAKYVRRAKVTGVFYSSAKLYGTPVTGEWTHYAVTPPAGFVYRETIKTASQAMAEKLEDRKNVLTALAEFGPVHVETAVNILKTEALYRSEKLLGAAQWLWDLHVIRDQHKGNAQHNLIWKAIALAPAGFCHPRSGMIGTLLEDIVAGLGFDEIKRRFDEKMHPLRYQRPQAAPSAGNIAQAEKVVEQMGISNSLKRRFARLDEVEAIWEPKVQAPKNAGGVFGHLVPKGQQAGSPLVIPPTTITWEKFQRTVMPEAEEIEFYVPRGVEAYTALVTAVDPEAPPILQWDSATARNPVSWYVYTDDSLPSSWNLSGGDFCKVTAITFQPTHWGSGVKYEHHGNSVVFCLENCRDVSKSGGLCLFPECLKSDLHGVRSTIEAFSRAGKLDDFEGPHACGIRLQKGQTWNAKFLVTTKGIKSCYVLDRWD